MNQILVFILILTFLGCDKNTTLLSDINLAKYLYREDSLLCSGIKEIPQKGSISWIANNQIVSYNGNYALVMTNFSDTTNWRNLESWAFLREHISVDLNPYKKGAIKLVSTEEKKSNPALFSASYTKLADGGDIIDATWSIDTSLQSELFVDNYDSLNNIVEGKFQLYFKLEKQSLLFGNHYDSLVHFKNGKFKAKIIK